MFICFRAEENTLVQCFGWEGAVFCFKKYMQEIDILII